MAGSKDVALAFGLVIGAGLSTLLGAASVFVLRPGIDLKITLACSLGLSAGVMIYISFVEIFAIKSIDGFKQAGYGNAEATRFATLCFFGGMALLWVMDKVVHAILHLAQHSKRRWSKQATCRDQEGQLTAQPIRGSPGTDSRASAPQPAPLQTGLSRTSIQSQESEESDLEAQAAQPSQAALPAGAATTSTADQGHRPTQHAISTRRAGTSGSTPTTATSQLPAAGQRPSVGTATPDRGSVDMEQYELHDAHEAVTMILRNDVTDKVGLSRTGLLAALAIGLHNLPEGLATYVATLADPTAGVVLALAIALHNIPEGVVVAMPVFIASGSKWKGFLWGAVSGITEPLGALIGYAVLHGEDLHPLAYGIMLGLVSGMMVWISVTELLPTAFKYDPQHTYSVAATITGMIIMALSLILFDV